MTRQVPLVHPGEILLKDWLEPMGLSQYALAKAIGVPPRRINEIVKGLRGITVDTALRLATYFGTDAQSWLNLQNHYDTELARESMHEALLRIAQHPCVQLENFQDALLVRERMTGTYVSVKPSDL
jgi:addiction module HigA family antidote